MSVANVCAPSRTLLGLEVGVTRSSLEHLPVDLPVASPVSGQRLQRRRHTASFVAEPLPVEGSYVPFAVNALDQVPVAHSCLTAEFMHKLTREYPGYLTGERTAAQKLYGLMAKRFNKLSIVLELRQACYTLIQHVIQEASSDKDALSMLINVGYRYSLVPNPPYFFMERVEGKLSMYTCLVEVDSLDGQAARRLLRGIVNESEIRRHFVHKARIEKGADYVRYFHIC